MVPSHDGRSGRSSETAEVVVRSGAALDGAALDGAALDGAALDGAALDGAALDGRALDGRALDDVLSVIGSEAASTNALSTNALSTRASDEHEEIMTIQISATATRQARRQSGVRLAAGRVICFDVAMAQNVLGGELESCSLDPLTGFYRDGCCTTGADDQGVHIVCARVTADFLEFSKAAGNDLSTPMPMYSFPGLQPGDQWCLCADRWVEAHEAGMAPQVVLEATHAAVLEWVTLDTLRQFEYRPTT